MKRPLLLVLALGAIAGALVLATCRGSQAPRAAAGATDAPAGARGGSGPVPAPARSTSSDPSPAPSPATGVARLAERRRLSRPASTPALEAMKRYERDELLLLAQIQRQTRRPPPAGVQDLLAARRGGAGYAELRALADEELAGDGELLLTVRGWLDAVVRRRGAADAADALPGAGATPLELGGRIPPR